MDRKVDPTDCQCTWDDNCWVEGRGTIRAIRGCRAHFDVHLSVNCLNNQLIDLTVEIKGPERTICSERIKLTQLRGSNFKGRPFQLGGPKGGTTNESNDSTESTESTLIPMWYLIVPSKISIYYIPLVIGIHKIRLFNKSAQIRGSPFTVYVEHDFNSLGNNSNCSSLLTRSITFDPSNCESKSTKTTTTQVNQEGPRVIGTMEKENHSQLNIDQSNLRKTKSTQLLTTKSVDPIESIWERPSVSGIENLRYSSESGRETDSSSSSSSVISDDDGDDDDVINLTISGCSKCWLPYHDYVGNDDLTLSTSDKDYWIKEMDKRYQEEHFKKHSFRVKSLIEYWNKMSVSTSSASNCYCCSEDDGNNQSNHQQSSNNDKSQ